MNFEGGHKNRVEQARASRWESYEALFKQLDSEQAVLEELYAPLQRHLANRGETERRLEFVVRRRVDLADWTARGEQLFDLRRRGPFSHQGDLGEIAEARLGRAWRRGDGATATAAMREFLEWLTSENASGQLASGVTRRRLADWLFSTSHIHLEYGLRYEGTNIEQLSPGTRGIVLLILYLAIDTDDDRPVIIDQPEENLDPRSVYKVLSKYFREAKTRRQVVIVSHNANLVVNTDAEQVIVATCERDGVSPLPRFRYQSGPLEDPAIRKHVCDLLEGGELAFLERENRYFTDRLTGTR
jgi:hypothetical protein